MVLPSLYDNLWFAAGRALSCRTDGMFSIFAIHGVARLCLENPRSALTRRSVLPLHRGGVNRGPARRCIWPVSAPAGGLCARAGLRGDAVLLRGLRSPCAHHTFLLACFAFDHACCLPHERQTGRLAECSVSIPPWVEIAVSAFSNCRYGYRTLLVHFGLARFLAAIPTENAERTRGRRTESAAQQSAFLRKCISFVAFSAGRTLGAARPQTCAKETRLPGLSSFGS